MMKIHFFGAALVSVMFFACKPQTDKSACCQHAKDAHLATDVNFDNPDSALVELKAGNERFVSGKSDAFNGYAEQRCASALKQKPFAVVVCCSDSRVPPEEVFDQGVGELFVVRTAGNVLDKASLGSIEYATEHLGVKLVVVLGHERCGAVTAAVEGGEAPDAIGYIVEQIKPAVDSAKQQQGDLLINAIHNNIDLVHRQIASSEPMLKELVEKGELKVVGAYYDLDEGKVKF